MPREHKKKRANQELPNYYQDFDKDVKVNEKITPEAAKKIAQEFNNSDMPPLPKKFLENLEDPDNTIGFNRYIHSSWGKL